MKETLLAHFAAYPAMTAQDAVKLLYQATFGPGHLIADPAMAAKRLTEERAECSKTDAPAFEGIGGGFCRLHLGAEELETVPDELLSRMFLLSAEKTGDMEIFSTRLAELEALAAEGKTPFSQAELAAYLTVYRAEGCPMVSHSQTYREAYAPAYRVVREEFARLLPLLQRMSAIGGGVIAIDGRAASGKSTLAELLSRLLQAPVVHMDDFFLPPEKRTPARLAEPGGNVDYERFADEVLPGLKTGDFSYGVFDCSVMRVTEQATVPAASWRIVEGSYSHHPFFAGYADLRVFLTVPPEEQLRRIVLRNGDEMAETFKTRWIPMEEHYFDSFRVRSKADLILE